MSRRVKALKRELHASITEAQACKQVDDLFILHEAKRLKRRMRDPQKIGAPFEIACADIDGLTLNYMQAELYAKEDSIR